MKKAFFRALAVVRSEQPEPVVSNVKILEAHGPFAVAEIGGKKYAAVFDEKTERYEVDDIDGLLEPDFKFDMVGQHSSTNVRVVVNGLDDVPPELLGILQEVFGSL